MAKKQTKTQKQKNKDTKEIHQSLREEFPVDRIGDYIYLGDGVYLKPNGEIFVDEE